MTSSEPVQGLDALVARVVAVDDLPGGRAPSHRLTLDLGARGRREATLSLPAVAARRRSLFLMKRRKNSSAARWSAP